MANAPTITLNENAKAWVAALRSGDYTQTQKMLRRVTKENGTSFCCLGVACDLYRNTVGGNWDTIVLADSELTPAVMDWLGLEDSIGTYYNANGNNFTLVGLNDNEYFTFAQIADVIKSQPKGLFHTE